MNSRATSRNASETVYLGGPLQNLHNELHFDEAAAEQLVHALGTLKPRHRQVIVRRFGLDGSKPATSREIALELKLSSTTVDQMARASLMLLRRASPRNSAKLRWQVPGNQFDDRHRTLAFFVRTVGELGLSMRSYNCLKNAGIETIIDLVTKTEPELLKTKNFGRKCLNEIKDLLAEHGLSLGMVLRPGPIVMRPDVDEAGAA